MNGLSDSDRFTRQILHAAAEQAKRETVRRLRAGREAKRARDAKAYVGGRPAFGYRAVNGELAIDPDAAAVVREIFERARRGESLVKIADALDWHPTSVARVLGNDAYKLVRGRIVDPRTWNDAQRALRARRRRRA